jgi:hypothetical protein
MWVRAKFSFKGPFVLLCNATPGKREVKRWRKRE